MASFLFKCRQVLTSIVSSPRTENKDQKFASNSDPVHLAFDLREPQGGVEGKTPIIFLHGITASKECWNDIPEKVAKGTKKKVYAVDLRNHGDSPWSETFEFHSNELDLRHFMETHEIDKAILVGHSMGGMIAMKFALAMPEKIDKLVVEDTTLGEIPKQLVTFLLHKLIIAEESKKEIPVEVDVEAAHKLLPEIMIQKVPKELREYARFDENIFQLKKADGEFFFKTNIHAIKNGLGSSPTAIPELQGRYDGPTLFIYGEKSPFNVGSDEAIIKKHFPSAELFGVQNAGHNVHNDSPSDFLGILLNFLRKEYVARL